MKNDRLRRIPAVVEQVKNTEYEVHNGLLNIFRLPAMLILNMLPTRMARAVLLFGSGPNGDARIVLSSVATYKALEVIYTFPERRAKGLTNTSDVFWENFLSNARSLRNRLLLVKREVLNIIKENTQKKGKVNLLSLGSGSARAVFEAVSLLNNQPPIHIKLIDISRRAINFSKELALNFNLDRGHIEWHRDYAQNLEKYCESFHPDLVEMVGLLDYYPYEPAVDLVAKIYKVLSPGGWLITSNIRSNFESPFIRKGVNWPLIYRSPEELVSIIFEGGFPLEGMKIIYEPLKIHGLVIAHKFV